jgi:hypothetical protein
MNFRIKKCLYALIVVLVITLSISAKAQSNAQSKVSRKGNVVSIGIGADQYQVEVCTPSMIRIRMAAKNGFAPDEQWMINRYNWDEVPFTFNEKNKVVEVKTSTLTVKITTNPVRIAFYKPDGELINQDDPSEKPMGYNNEAPLCTKQLQPGEQLMVCPVTTKGAKSRTVYLPEGKWVDYWSGEKFEGKKNILTLTPLAKLPIYVKAGAIIPMQPDMQYFGEKPVDPVTLDIYPSGNSSYKMYEDDGLSLKYQNGEFAQTEIRCSETSQSVTIDILPSEGKFKAADRNYKLQVHLDKKPESVTSEDVAVINWNFYPEKKTLGLTVAKKSAEKISVKINR